MHVTTRSPTDSITWNAGMLMSEDLQKAMMANMAKSVADFKD